MKKEALSETDETSALINSTSDLITQLRFDFLILHTKSYIEVCKESPKFVVTMRLERKGVKSQR